MGICHIGKEQGKGCERKYAGECPVGEFLVEYQMNQRHKNHHHGDAYAGGVCDVEEYSAVDPECDRRSGQCEEPQYLIKITVNFNTVLL